MSACSDRSLAKFQYQSFEGMSTALGSIGAVLGVGKFIPHPVAQAVAKVGALAGAGAAGARWAAKQYRDNYDSLEGACQQEQGPDPHQPTSPKPTSGGGGGGSFGGGATSGGYAPRMDWVWQAGSAIDDGDGGVIVTSGKWVVVWRPIVFDLNNDGFDFRSASDPIVTDSDFNGVASTMAWVGPTDGLLVYDYNQNGVGEMAEWVLTSFVPGATNDLEALRAFDSNRDGMFNSGDAEYSKFRIGIDANQDGLFSAGELHQLSQFNFNGMALTEGYDVVNRGGAEMVPGVRFDYTGNAFTTTGALLKYASVGFVETPNQVQLYADSNATIVAKEDVKTIFWNGGALNVSLDTFSYGGQGEFDNVMGSTANDIIVGNDGANSLYGGAGADHLVGGAGNDVLIADEADLLYGFVRGGTGFDTLILDGPVSGTVYAVPLEVDAIIGGAGDDNLSGAGAQHIFLMGGEGNDVLTGSDFEDVLSGGEGYDTLYGGLGDDMYLVERGFGIDVVNDSGGAKDVVSTSRSFYDVILFEASGNDQVLTFNDGSQLVLVNGRIGLGVEEVQFDDFTYTRNDINVTIDWTW